MLPPPQEPNNTDHLLTPTEVAAIIRQSRAHVYALVERGDLAVIKVGNGSKRPRFVIRRSELDRFLASRETRVVPLRPPAAMRPTGTHADVKAMLEFLRARRR